MTNIFIILIVIGLCLVFNGLTILLIIHIYKISKCIYGYKEKLKKYLALIQNRKENSNIKNGNNKKVDDFNHHNSLENIPL